MVSVALVVSTGCLPIPDPPPAPTSTVNRRVAVYGDSVALTLGWYANSAVRNRATYVGGIQRLGCGVGRGGLVWRDGGVGDISECDGILTEWAADAQRARPDVAVICVGPWDTLLRLVPGDSQWRHLGDPVYDRYLLGEMLAATDALTGAGVPRVVWMVLPPMHISEHSDAESERRQRAWRDLVDWVDELRPGVVSVADQWAWSGPRGEDAEIRPDGVHYSEDGAVYTWRAWLLDLALGA